VRGRVEEGGRRWVLELGIRDLLLAVLLILRERLLRMGRVGLVVPPSFKVYEDLPPTSIHRNDRRHRHPGQSVPSSSTRR
jgi:hypothetical protein